MKVSLLIILTYIKIKLIPMYTCAFSWGKEGGRGGESITGEKGHGKKNLKTYNL